MALMLGGGGRAGLGFPDDDSCDVLEGSMYISSGLSALRSNGSNGSVLS